MNTKPARGMRDFLPAAVRRRAHVLEVVRDTYERYGFEPLETPAAENLETLLGKYGDEGNQLIFKILKRGAQESSGAADLALRYDLTVPLARVVAEYRATLPRFFKRYQIQPVWRADRPARGRFREFYQCDLDVVGSTSPLVEVELIQASSAALQALGFEDFRVRLNDRRLLPALLSRSGVPEALHQGALVSLDKLDKLGPAGVLGELTDRGVPEGAARDFLARVGGDAASVEGGSPGAAPAEAPDAALDRLEGALGDGAGLESLRTICRLLEATGAAARVQVDASLARGLSYYTGAIIEITVPDLAGSLGGGGRYDGLVGMFLGKEVPACGFSLGLERILVVMDERGMFPDAVTRPAADVMVTQWNEEGIAESLQLASVLRRAGLRVDLYPEQDRLAKQFKYAAGRQMRFVVVVGDDERAAGQIAIKNMATGEQQTFERDQGIAYLQQRLRDAEDGPEAIEAAGEPVADGGPGG